MRYCLVCLAIALAAVSAQAKPQNDSDRKFHADYDVINVELVNLPGEVAKIENFVYQKDLLRLEFISGEIYLLRHIDGRPTSAIFLGSGRATLDPRAHVERQSIKAFTGDSLIDESFETCFIRMADDLDLRLKEQLKFDTIDLKWKEFTQLKQSKGEEYFKPVIQHTYDNFFELTASLQNRTADGYFWCDFNRFTVTYDPLLPEQFVVAYEVESGAFMPSEMVRLQRQSQALYDDSSVSHVTYPVTITNVAGEFEMSGAEGDRVKAARVALDLTVNYDQLRYLPFFMHFNLKPDSIFVNGARCDFVRRNDFRFVGILAPEPIAAGQTATVTFYYRGVDFDYLIPYVMDPTPAPHLLTFTVPRGFNYIIPGKGPSEPVPGGMERFEVAPQQPFDKFYFESYATGFDTLTVSAEIGLPINFVQSRSITKAQECFVPDQIYQNGVKGAFDFFADRLGGPVGTFSVDIYPEGFFSMPGLIKLPKLLCYNQGTMSAVGGFELFAGYAVAQQWYGKLLKPASYREQWLQQAAAEYLGLMYVAHSKSQGAYYSNLLARRDSLYRAIEIRRDRVLATGDRAGDLIISNKGCWLFHMLRILMIDLDNNSEERFRRFLYELALRGSGKTFTNADIVALAEKHYGGTLDWFFDHWLFGEGLPVYSGSYAFVQRDGQWFVDGQVAVEAVEPSFRMPVVIKVTSGGDKFFRVTLSPSDGSFSLGPFAEQPSDVKFNEFFSVLARDRVKQGN